MPMNKLMFKMLQACYKLATDNTRTPSSRFFQGLYLYIEVIVFTILVV